MEYKGFRIEAALSDDGVSGVSAKILPLDRTAVAASVKAGAGSEALIAINMPIIDHPTAWNTALDYAINSATSEIDRRLRRR
jgi:hypothetical protein